MLVLIATSYFSTVEGEVALELHTPEGPLIPVYCISDGRDVLREMLEGGIIDQPNFDYLRDELNRSNLPYDAKGISLKTKMRQAEDDIDDLFKQIGELQAELFETGADTTEEEPEGTGEYAWLSSTRKLN